MECWGPLKDAMEVNFRNAEMSYDLYKYFYFFALNAKFHYGLHTKHNICHDKYFHRF